jgi:hypothetical protein
MASTKIDEVLRKWRAASGWLNHLLRRHGHLESDPVGFIGWLGRRQLLAHYVDGPLVPNMRGKYCPA